MCSLLPFQMPLVPCWPVYVSIIITPHVRADYLQAIVVTERDVVAMREPEFDDDVEELVARVVDGEDEDEEDDDDEFKVSYSSSRLHVCV